MVRPGHSQCGGKTVPATHGRTTKDTSRAHAKRK